ncbi:SDR family NAD(P)-dependent oxidoreductase [Bacillus licheniformis]|nr:SDR family NAD(P)-dependent oxidoreductase [Bacillus licheniformis]
MPLGNVGGPKGGSLLDLTDDDWTSSFELHLLSYVRLIREAFPYLKKDGGRIVNIASSSVKQPIPGLLLSKAIAKEGANVMLSGRHEADLKKAAEELNGLGGGTVSYQVCDLADADGIKALVQKTADTFGTIDMLVN